LAKSPQLPLHYLELVKDCALKSYNYRRNFAAFIRNAGVSEAFVAGWTSDETKRDLMERLLPTLNSKTGGALAINRMTDSLLEMDAYPDWDRQEDKTRRVAEAKAAQKQLRAYIRKKSDEVRDEREAELTRERARSTRAASQERAVSLSGLQERLDKLAMKVGEQQAGYDFENWFFDVADYFEIANHRPFRNKGRQMDGSLTVEGTTYLIELKFQNKQSGATDIDSILARVRGKADNTMAILISISGYSSVAKTEASHDKTPLLLFDHAHLYMLFGGSMKLDEMIIRARRHSSRTGAAYLALADFDK
jgi:hypothetical protein